ncbi:MAG: GNAT family N-acetyltransferase [Bacilli bacterium]|jgi:ribosomal protein S18 acetylase RimI-like enzyme|nr:GNAT family N-acetyltransferase [Bacilli bacterium]
MELKEAEQKEEFLKIQSMARSIWPHVYQGVIPPEQISLLLDKYFSDQGINHFLLEGYRYFLIYFEGKEAGFIAIKEYPDYVYLDKLYLKEEFRRHHIASDVFDHLIAVFNKDIVLNVNQNNEAAVKTYLAKGFKIVKNETIKLKDGMVNNDYVMRKKA